MYCSRSCTAQTDLEPEAEISRTKWPQWVPPTMGVSSTSCKASWSRSKGDVVARKGEQRFEKDSEESIGQLCPSKPRDGQKLPLIEQMAGQVMSQRSARFSSCKWRHCSQQTCLVCTKWKISSLLIFLLKSYDIFILDKCLKYLFLMYLTLYAITFCTLLKSFYHHCSVLELSYLTLEQLLPDKLQCITIVMFLCRPHSFAHIMKSDAETQSCYLVSFIYERL